MRNIDCKKNLSPKDCSINTIARKMHKDIVFIIMTTDYTRFILLDCFTFFRNSAESSRVPSVVRFDIRWIFSVLIQTKMGASFGLKMLDFLCVIKLSTGRKI